MRQYFVMNNAGIIPHENVFQSHSGNFGEQNTTKCVDKGSVDVKQFQDQLVGRALFENSHFETVSVCIEESFDRE